MWIRMIGGMFRKVPVVEKNWGMTIHVYTGYKRQP